MYNKILVPLDGSELAELALAPALDLARAGQGSVTLLRSAVPLYAPTPAIASEYQWAASEFSNGEMRAEARDYLEDVKERYRTAGVRLYAMDVVGDPAGMIVDTADDEAVDLIVMSTHGWSGFKKWILGSVTERVLHSVSCPVLALRSSQPIKRLLLTLDGSELAEKAIEPALAVAAGLKATVTLLRVSEPLPVNLRSSAQFEWDINKEVIYQLGQQNYAEAEDYLHGVAGRIGRHDVDVLTSVVEGHAVDKILQFAGLHHIDLIAMSTHGRTGIRRWLYGSVTAKVMHSFNSHMLIVRRTEDQISHYQN